MSSLKLLSATLLIALFAVPLLSLLAPLAALVYEAEAQGNIWIEPFATGIPIRIDPDQAAALTVYSRPNVFDPVSLEWLVWPEPDPRGQFVDFAVPFGVYESGSTFVTISGPTIQPSLPFPSVIHVPASTFTQSPATYYLFIRDATGRNLEVAEFLVQDVVYGNGFPAIYAFNPLKNDYEETPPDDQVQMIISQTGEVISINLNHANIAHYEPGSTVKFKIEGFVGAREATVYLGFVGSNINVRVPLSGGTGEGEIQLPMNLPMGLNMLIAVARAAFPEGEAFILAFTYIYISPKIEVSPFLLRGQAGEQFTIRGWGLPFNKTIGVDADGDPTRLEVALLDNPYVTEIGGPYYLQLPDNTPSVRIAEDGTVTIPTVLLNTSIDSDDLGLFNVIIHDDDTGASFINWGVDPAPSDPAPAGIFSPLDIAYQSLVASSPDDPRTPEFGDDVIAVALVSDPRQTPGDLQAAGFQGDFYPARSLMIVAVYNTLPNAPVTFKLGDYALNETPVRTGSNGAIVTLVEVPPMPAGTYTLRAEVGGRTPVTVVLAPDGSSTWTFNALWWSTGVQRLSGQGIFAGSGIDTYVDVGIVTQFTVYGLTPNEVVQVVVSVNSSQIGFSLSYFETEAVADAHGTLTFAVPTFGFFTGDTISVTVSSPTLGTDVILPARLQPGQLVSDSPYSYRVAGPAQVDVYRGTTNTFQSGVQGKSILYDPDLGLNKIVWTSVRPGGTLVVEAEGLVPGVEYGVYIGGVRVASLAATSDTDGDGAYEGFVTVQVNLSPGVYKVEIRDEVVGLVRNDFFTWDFGLLGNVPSNYVVVSEPAAAAAEANYRVITPLDPVPAHYDPAATSVIVAAWNLTIGEGNITIGVSGVGEVAGLFADDIGALLVDLAVEFDRVLGSALETPEGIYNVYMRRGDLNLILPPTQIEITRTFSVPQLSVPVNGTFSVEAFGLKPNSYYVVALGVEPGAPTVTIAGPEQSDGNGSLAIVGVSLPPTTVPRSIYYVHLIDVVTGEIVGIDRIFVEDATGSTLSLQQLTAYVGEEVEIQVEGLAAIAPGFTGILDFALGVVQPSTVSATLTRTIWYEQIGIDSGVGTTTDATGATVTVTTHPGSIEFYYFDTQLRDITGDGVPDFADPYMGSPPPATETVTIVVPPPPPSLLLDPGALQRGLKAFVQLVDSEGNILAEVAADVVILDLDPTDGLVDARLVFEMPNLPEEYAGQPIGILVKFFYEVEYTASIPEQQRFYLDAAATTTATATDPFDTNVTTRYNLITRAWIEEVISGITVPAVYTVETDYLRVGAVVLQPGGGSLVSLGQVLSAIEGVVSRLDAIQGQLATISSTAARIETAVGELTVIAEDTRAIVEDVRGQIAEVVIPGIGELQVTVDEGFAEVLGAVGEVRMTVEEVGGEVIARLDTGFNTVIANQEQMLQLLSAIGATLVEVRDGIAVLQTQVGTIQADVEDLQTLVAEAADQILLAIDEQTGALEMVIRDESGRVIAELGARIDALAPLIEDVAEGVATIETSIGEVVMAVEELAQANAEILGVVEENNRLLVVISTNVGTIAATLDAVKGLIEEDVVGGITALQEDLTQLAEQNAQLSGQIAEVLAAVQAVQQQVARIDEVQAAVEALGEEVSGAVQEGVQAIQGRLDTLETTLTQRIDQLSSTVQESNQQISQKLDDVSEQASSAASSARNLGIVNAVLSLVVLAAAGYIAFLVRQQTAG